MPRQRHDLRQRPGEVKDEFGNLIPTPLFIASTDGFPVSQEPPPFAQLLWSPANREGKHTEVCAHSPTEVAEYVAQGYLTKPPMGIEVDPMEAIQQQFAALSEEDQQFLLAAQAQDKKAKLQAALASLSERDLEALLNKTQKRGPGRPKKAIA